MRESLDLVRVGTQRIAGITQELRTFSRPAAETSRVDVNAAVTSVLKLVGKELESRARVEVNLADAPPARADMAQLVQVILNLVINAIQALPAGHAETCYVWISTAVQGDRVVIEVADNGPGRPNVTGWTNTTLRETSGLRRHSVGTALGGGSLGAGLSYWK